MKTKTKALLLAALRKLDSAATATLARCAAQGKAVGVVTDLLAIQRVRTRWTRRPI